MLYYVAVAAALCASLGAAQNPAPPSVLKTWSDAAMDQGIVGAGGMLPSLDLKYVLDLTYHSGGGNITVGCTPATTAVFDGADVVVDGRFPQYVTPFHSRNQPGIVVDLPAYKFYAMFMHDIEGGFEHFTVFNAVGGDFSVGQIIHPFFSPLNFNAANHTYTFVVFEQDGPVTLDPADISAWTSVPIAGRTGFNVSAIADKYNLNPVAINWHKTHVDAWVPGAWRALLQEPFLPAALAKNFAGVPDAACKALKV